MPPDRGFEVDLAPGSPILHQMRVRFTTSGRVVLTFTVQYEICMGGEWFTILRYDTSHGEAHLDRYGPAGAQVAKEWLGQVGPPYNHTFTTALEDIRQNWEAYFSAFEAMKRDLR